jgi:2,4-dienoyl-CoA reductase-like NADH-dependent reductase (Old Yellow Enzyme family)
MTLLGTTLRVRDVLLRNRIVSAPMERNYGNLDGTVTERYVAYLRARAAGGAALVFTEAAYVRGDGRGRTRELGVHGDHVIPGLRSLADAVHAEGALLGVELNHAGRVARAAVSGFTPLAPSAVPHLDEQPRVPDAAEVATLARAYGEAAARCVRAGVDVLEIHAAHGYLIAQFLSPRTNHRDDVYADPVRFGNEVITAVRRAAPSTPLFLRISAFEGVEGGLEADATFDLVRRMRLDLVDVIDVTAGNYESGEWMVQPGEFSRGVLAPYAARYRDLGKIVSVAGRLSTGDVAEAVLRAGHADLVAVGRALHADPDWPRKALAGVSPRPCIACNQGCIDQLHTQQPIWCVVNPDTGHEWRRPPRVAVRRRRVVVIGGGVAGLEAARTSASRGHDVVLVESRDVLGGQYRLAAQLHSRPEFMRLLDWYATELEESQVDIRTSTRADANVVADLAPDVVVVATGGRAFMPPVPGIDLPHVSDVRAWLEAGQPLAGGTPVTVWGADRAGVATAEAIITAGHSVLLVGTQPELAPEAGPREKTLAVRRLQASPLARIELSTTVEAIEPGRLLTCRGAHREWIGAPGPLLISQGTIPATPNLGDGNWRTHTIGEAAFATSAATAIREGANVVTLFA